MTVSLLFEAPQPHAHQEGGAHYFKIQTPLCDDDTQALTRALNEECLTSDSRALWLAYPNLRDAADKLIDLVGLSWPVRNEKHSAAISAILQAIKQVQAGLVRGEASREHVIVNFHRGLGMIAQDLVHTEAWAYMGNRVVEKWNPMEGRFLSWANDEKFNEIRFFTKENVALTEIDGTRWKLTCAVSNAKDVGVISKYR